MLARAAAAVGVAALFIETHLSRLTGPPALTDALRQAFKRHRKTVISD